MDERTALKIAQGVNTFKCVPLATENTAGSETTGARSVPGKQLALGLSTGAGLVLATLAVTLLVRCLANALGGLGRRVRNVAVFAVEVAWVALLANRHGVRRVGALLGLVLVDLEE